MDPVNKCAMLLISLCFLTVAAKHIQTSVNAGQINNVNSGNRRASVDLSQGFQARRLGPEDIGPSRPSPTMSFRQSLWDRRRFRLQKWRQHLAKQRRRALQTQPIQPHTHVVDRNGVVMGVTHDVPRERVRPTPQVARLTIPIVRPTNSVEKHTIPIATSDRSNVQPIPASKQRVHIPPLHMGNIKSNIGTPNVDVRPAKSVEKHTIPITISDRWNIQSNIQATPVSKQRIQIPALHSGNIKSKIVPVLIRKKGPNSMPSKTVVNQMQGQEGVHQLMGDHSHRMDNTAIPNAQNIQQAQNENLSILTLLNDRQPVVKDKADEAKLKKHLLKVSRMQRTSGLVATDQRLIRMQLEYIYKIPETAIKREVLKLFVKDIVEKSEFLSSSQQTSAADLAEMASLFELIKSISANNSISILPSPAMPRTNSLSSKINLGLDINNYQRPSKTPQQLPSVNLDHLVGLSVYGDRPGRRVGGRNDRNNARQRVPNSTTLPTTTFNPRLEPLGGNDAYWTHLSVGFQDMLCALCQRQNKQTCINKYCQKDGEV